MASSVGKDEDYLRFELIGCLMNIPLGTRSVDEHMLRVAGLATVLKFADTTPKYRGFIARIIEADHKFKGLYTRTLNPCQCFDHMLKEDIDLYVELFDESPCRCESLLKEEMERNSEVAEIRCEIYKLVSHHFKDIPDFTTKVIIRNNKTLRIEQMTLLSPLRNFGLEYEPNEEIYQL